MVIHGEPEQQPSSAGPRKPFSLQKKDLSPQLVRCLDDARYLFTRPHSVEKPGQHVAPTRKPTNVFFVDRRLASATISNHASSLLYPLKDYHQSNAPRFADVPIRAQLWRMATVLQKQGDTERSSTREDLQELNKWLDWDEVLEARSLQRSRFEMARSRRERAREACDLPLLSLYCHIPPGRGQDAADRPGSGTFGALRRNRNVALLQRDGGIILHLQDYQTFRTARNDGIAIEVDSELCRLFKQFVAYFRPLFHPGQSNDYLFANAHGESYSSGSFPKRLQRLFDRLTGCQLSINVLRSFFLTWAYSQRQLNNFSRRCFKSESNTIHRRLQTSSSRGRGNLNQLDKIYM